jgi:hypothetical protein
MENSTIPEDISEGAVPEIAIQKPWKKEFYHSDYPLPKSDLITVRISYEYDPDEEDGAQHSLRIRIESGVTFVVVRSFRTLDEAMEYRTDIIILLFMIDYLDEFYRFSTIP